MAHPFTAHPKVDPATGELFGIGYNVESKPYLYYFGLDAEGALKFDVPIDTPVRLWREKKKTSTRKTKIDSRSPPPPSATHAKGSSSRRGPCF